MKVTDEQLTKLREQAEFQALSGKPPWPALAALLAELEGARKTSARLRGDLVRGICAAASGDMAIADKILDAYWPDRPKLPDLRAMTHEEMWRIVTGADQPKEPQDG